MAADRWHAMRPCALA